VRPTNADEMVDKENSKILGSLTHEAWKGLAVEGVAAKWYSLETDQELEARLLEAEHPLQHLIDDARQSSGSVGGEHRKDLRDVLIGSPQQATNLSVPIVNAQTANPTPVPEKKRGF